MSDIFLSYAGEDRERIQPLVHALQKTGWSIFWDRTIPTGKTWREVVATEIEKCRAMVVVWSQTSIDSDWVQDEAAEGRRRHVLFPVRIDDVTPPFGFRAIQAADLMEWTGNDSFLGYTRLVNDLVALLGPSPRSAREAERVAREEARREAEETRKREEAAMLAADEERRKRAEQEAKRKVEEEEQRKAEESRKQTEAEGARKEKAAKPVVEEYRREKAEQVAEGRAEEAQREREQPQTTAGAARASDSEAGITRPDVGQLILPVIALGIAVWFGGFLLLAVLHVVFFFW